MLINLGSFLRLYKELESIILNNVLECFKKTLYPLCWLINFFFLEANLMLASVP